MTRRNAVRIIRRFRIFSLDNDILKRPITPTVLRHVIIQKNYVSFIMANELGHIKHCVSYRPIPFNATQRLQSQRGC